MARYRRNPQTAGRVIDGQAFVVAKTRDFDAEFVAGLDDRLARRDFDFNPIDG